MKNNKLMIIAGCALILSLGTACNKLQSKKASEVATNNNEVVETSSNSEVSPSSEENTPDNSAVYTQLQKKALSEMLTEIQIVQVDGLMDNTPSMQATSGWGSVEEEVRTDSASSTSGGWGAAANPPSVNDPDPDPRADGIVVTRDCPLGGTFSHEASPVSAINPGNASLIFAEATTPEIRTDIRKSTIVFDNCNVTDKDFNEYTISGTLVGTSAVTRAVFTAEEDGSGITFDGSGSSRIRGDLTITDGDKEIECDVDLSANVSESYGDVIVKHKAGVVAIDASASGSLCGDSTDLNLTDTIEF